MKIFELPAEIQRYVFSLQIEQGNRPNPNADLLDKASDGNFDWHKTKEHFRFWDSINRGYYIVFYKAYPNKEIPYSVQNLTLADHLAEMVIKQCGINLSESAQDDMIKTLNKVFDGYALECLFQTRHEIIDSYKVSMRDRINRIANFILKADFYYEEEGQKVGYSVMLRTLIAEIVETLKDKFVESYLETSCLSPEHSDSWLKMVADKAVNKLDIEFLNKPV